MFGKKGLRESQKKKLSLARQSGVLNHSEARLLSVLESSTEFLSWATNRTLVLYHPLQEELSLLSLDRTGHTCAYVRVESGLPIPEMTVRLANLKIASDWEAFQVSAQNVLKQPSSETKVVDVATPLLAFVPGLGFDRDGRRLGRGKGYYDRFLSKCTDVIKVGIVGQPHLLDEVPSDPWDVTMDYLLTEETLEKVIHG